MGAMDNDLDRMLFEMQEGLEQEEEKAPEAAFKDAMHAENFILAGKAIFTLRSKKTGTRFTYKVTKADPNPKFPGDSWFVALLTGPQNDADYTYLGMIKDNVFRLTSKSRLQIDSPSVVAFRWSWSRLIQGKLPEQLEVWHAGRCGRCGRLLTVPESVERGIGPDCADMM